MDVQLRCKNSGFMLWYLVEIAVPRSVVGDFLRKGFDYLVRREEWRL